MQGFRKILFIITTQPDNLGDMIQYRNIIKVFQQLGDVVIDDYWLKERHWKALGIAETHLLSKNKHLPDLRKLRGLLKLLLSRVKPYDAVLTALTSQQYRYDIRSIIRELIRLQIYVLLRFKGIKVYQFGMTCDHSKLYGILLRIERVKSRMHSIYSVRDINVYKQLKSLSLCNLFYCPDIFYWDSPKVFHQHIVTTSQEKSLTVLISVREKIPDILDELSYTNKLTGKISNIIDSLPKDTKIIFAYQVLTDYEINRCLYEKNRTKANCYFIKSCLDLYTAESLYSQCNLIISNRQHCVLYGAKLGVPILALTDTNLHWKLCGALYDLGVPEYLADINEADENVIRKCKTILEKRGEVSERLISLVKKKREEAINFLREQIQVQIEGI